MISHNRSAIKGRRQSSCEKQKNKTGDGEETETFGFWIVQLIDIQHVNIQD